MHSNFRSDAPDGAPVNTHACDPRANHLLGALPPTDWRRWVPLLEPVDLPLGKVLYGSGRVLSYVYFPTTAIVSLLYVTESGASAEIAVVGNEGLVGVSVELPPKLPPATRVSRMNPSPHAIERGRVLQAAVTRPPTPPRRVTLLLPREPLTCPNGHHMYHCQRIRKQNLCNVPSVPEFMAARAVVGPSVPAAPSSD